MKKCDTREIGAATIPSSSRKKWQTLPCSESRWVWGGSVGRAGRCFTLSPELSQLGWALQGQHLPCAVSSDQGQCIGPGSGASETRHGGAVPGTAGAKGAGLSWPLRWERVRHCPAAGSSSPEPSTHHRPSTAAAGGARPSSPRVGGDAGNRRGRRALGVDLGWLSP